MFGSGKKSGGFGLGNFLQKAKQATEQIQAKAQEAAQQVQQAASTGDLSQIGSSLMVSFLKVNAFNEISSILLFSLEGWTNLNFLGFFKC